MTNKGQIVEIPENALLYGKALPKFSTKKEELIWKSQNRPYTLFDGFLVGGHAGVNHFKIGQRKGINVGGKKQPLYVIAIDEENNRLFVGAGENHPGLWTEVISFDPRVIKWNQENHFTLTALVNGISVEISSSVLEEKIPAVLYIMEEEGFLAFEQPSLMALKENSIDVYHQNSLIANII